MSVFNDCMKCIFQDGRDPQTCEECDGVISYSEKNEEGKNLD